MEIEGETSAPLRILQLEDDPGDAELAERELRKHGLAFSSVCVATEQAFLRALDEFRPDLVIADYSLPQFDCLRALKLVRERDATMPFILLTGAVSEETAVACMKAGATDYLLKERATRLPFAVLEAMDTRRALAARQAAENVERETKANLLALITNTKDRMWAVDSEYRLIVVNPAFMQGVDIGGRQVVAVGECIFVEGLPQDVRDQWRGYYDRALSGESFGIETVVRIHAEPRHIDYRFNPIRDPDGTITGVAVTGRDITERKQAEEALRHNQAMLARTESIAQVGSWEWDVESDTVTWSDELFRILQRDPAAGAPSFAEHGALYHPEDLQRLNDALTVTLRDGTPFEVELRIVPKNGRTQVCLGRGQAERHGDHPVRLVGSLQDITERKRAEEAERDQRALAEALRDTAAALNRTLDFDQVLDRILENAGRVVPCDAAELLLAGPADQARVARRNGQPRSHRSDGQRFPVADYANLQQIMSTCQPLVILDTRNYAGWVESPETRWIRSCVGAPILWRNRVTGLILLYSAVPGRFSDEEARRLAAFADQAAVALENARLFTEVATGREQMRALSRRLLDAQEAERRHVARELHDEIGQLLTGLKLILQMSAAAEPAGPPRGFAEAEALAGELISRVRQLSLDLRPAMLDDLGLLAALLWHLHRYTAQTQVEVDFGHGDLQGRRFAPEIETAAYRIVQEALTNVARHSGARQATVRVWSDGEALTVQVADQGAGFDPGPALAGDRTGGLAGMRERAELLGGTWTLETSPGQGVRITAALPLPEPGTCLGPDEG